MNPSLRFLVLSLSISLGLTLAIEIIGALIAGKRGRALVIVLLVNVLTNPPAVLASVCITGLLFPLPAVEKLCILAIEAVVVCVEALVYRSWWEYFWHPWRLSLALNAASFVLGTLMQLLILF